MKFLSQSSIFIQDIASKMLSLTWWPFCSGLSMFRMEHSSVHVSLYLVNSFHAGFSIWSKYMYDCCTFSVISWPRCHKSAFKSSPPSATYIHRWIWSELVQIMACHLDGAKPLSELMLTYYQLDHKEHISMKFYLKFKCLHSRNAFEHAVCQIGCYFVQGEMS